jgi:hypothetical protein
MTFPQTTLDVTHSTEPGPTGLPFPLHDIAVRLARASVISIAPVRGRARGSGAEFIVSCDMSFASREKANLGHWEVGASAVPGAAGIERLSALVGRSRALEIIIGCEDFDADTAERYGWINRSKALFKPVMCIGLVVESIYLLVSRVSVQLDGFDEGAVRFQVNDRHSSFPGLVLQSL